jgi:glycosyltransferase involved in cell wall biosynthesis
MESGPDSPAEARKLNAGKNVVMLLSNPATTDQRPLREAHALAQAGFPITILAWDREGETKRDTRFPDGLVVKRMRIEAGHGTPFLTVPRLIIFYIWCLTHLLGRNSKVIHCHDVDTLPAGILAVTLMRSRPKLVYDMHDLPEVFLRFFPLVSQTQRITLAFCRKMASMIVIVADSSIDWLSSRGFDKSKLTVVTNTPSISEARLRIRTSNQLRIFYYGWLGKERGVGVLVKAAQSIPNVSLKVAGRGDLEKLIRTAEDQFQNIKYLGWLDTREIDAEALQSDLIPTLYEPRSRNAQLAIPGKLMTAMSLSTPALVPLNSYQAKVVDQFGCGLVVDPRNTDEVLNAIRRLASDIALYNELGKAGYDAFRSYFNWEVMQSRLVNSYSALTHGG